MNKTIANQEAARELALYVENTEHLYRYCIVPYIQSLYKKCVKGTYDPEKALPGWERIAAEGAKMYEKEFLSVRYYHVFNRATREEAARYLQEFFKDMVCEGV